MVVLSIDHFPIGVSILSQLQEWESKRTIAVQEVLGGLVGIF
jgi:hypothetical protein